MEVERKRMTAKVRYLIKPSDVIFTKNVFG